MLDIGFWLVIMILMNVTPILEDHYYHVYNRGVTKQTLFYDKSDYSRFLFLLLHLQSPVAFSQTNRHIKKYLESGDFGVSPDQLNQVLEGRFVEIVNFCIMPNHFHLTLRAVTDVGVSKYIQKVSNAYAKYFNTRYEKSGHVFQGVYKARLITTDQQLAYLSAYVHRNPQEINAWKDISYEYPWSSYQDYSTNRWGSLIKLSVVKDTFNSFSEYQEFVEASGAKEDWDYF